MITPDAIASVDCPTCGAGRQEPCSRGAAVRVMVGIYVHVARYRLAAGLPKGKRARIPRQRIRYRPVRL